MLSMSLMLFSTLLVLIISPLFWTLVVISLTLMMIVFSPMLMQFSSLMAMTSMSAIDPLSSTLILLSLWITMLMLLASGNLKMTNNNPKLFCLVVLLLGWVLLMCFAASNLMIFYIWFEASLIPTMLLIMLWGYQPERLQASMYLMIYTVTASLPLLLILCKISQLSGHMSMFYPWVMFPQSFMPLLSWLMITGAFLVKLPLFAVHLWLPKAHVEAPVAGSMILAAILLKLGGYGLLRINNIFQDHVPLSKHPIMCIALIGAVITSLICLRQPDLKSLIAYSSVGHMGLMIAGLLTSVKTGTFGAMAMMIAHGLISSGLFCLANITYEYTHTRSIALTKGILAISPILSMWWFLMVCANMAAPPSINLLSEILLITASLSTSTLLLIPLSLISFFTVAYSLHLFASTSHGSPMQVMNPMPALMPRNLLLTSLHLTPAIGLIMMPDLITIW